VKERKHNEEEEHNKENDASLCVGFGSVLCVITCNLLALSCCFVDVAADDKGKVFDSLHVCVCVCICVCVCVN